MIPDRCRPRVRIFLVVAVASSLPACFGAVAAQTLVAHVIAGGGGISRSPGSCRSLEGSMGESAVGASSNAVFKLNAGFWASAGSVARDSVFRSGFEGCQ